MSLELDSSPGPLKENSAQLIPWFEDCETLRRKLDYSVPEL
jgi:hypothetical protein